MPTLQFLHPSQKRRPMAMFGERDRIEELIRSRALGRPVRNEGFSDLPGVAHEYLAAA